MSNHEPGGELPQIADWEEGWFHAKDPRHEAMDACRQHVPDFGGAEESKEAFAMPDHEYRAKFPRFHGECSCGFSGIAYASFAHYIGGDW